LRTLANEWPTQGRRGAVRVIVDRDACESNGVCADLVPEIFELDDEDVLHITPGPVPGALADLVTYAVRSCPKAALRTEP
jgi:ferredoxin